MTNLVQAFEAKQASELLSGKNFPKFNSGDTIRVLVKISDEGTTERTQAYEGLCIAKSKGGLNANFTVRKISAGEGVERTFHLCSPKIAGIELVKKGAVRRAKLYYMRELRGKAARLKEKVDHVSAAGAAPSAAEASASAGAAASV